MCMGVQTLSQSSILRIDFGEHLTINKFRFCFSILQCDITINVHEAYDIFRIIMYSQRVKIYILQ